MRVLVACEFSGIVRKAFRDLGHDAWSCDWLAAEDGDEHHMQCGIHDIPYNKQIHGYWDLMIAHPPCTNLAVSGARWFKDKLDSQRYSIAFFMYLINAPIAKICVENPIGIMSTKYRKPNQIIQPWQFGHDASKATCLWLKGLPLLQPTNILPGGPKARRANQTPSGQNKLGPSADRWKERSRTYTGIAQAMAEQWGGTP